MTSSQPIVTFDSTNLDIFIAFFGDVSIVELVQGISISHFFPKLLIDREDFFYKPEEVFFYHMNCKMESFSSSLTKDRKK